MKYKHRGYNLDFLVDERPQILDIMKHGSESKFLHNNPNSRFFGNSEIRETILNYSNLMFYHIGCLTHLASNKELKLACDILNPKGSASNRAILLYNLTHNINKVLDKTNLKKEVKDIVACIAGMKANIISEIYQIVFRKNNVTSKNI